MQIHQSSIGRDGLCLAGGKAEPTLSIDALAEALKNDDIEQLRPLMPIGYETGAAAYRKVAGELTVGDLSNHYRDGLEFFHKDFVPHLKARLSELSGGVWSFDDFDAFAAGSDVDLMTHIVDGVGSDQKVALFPGGWYGFLVGTSQRKLIEWSVESTGSLACLCVPSVRNGHLTTEMAEFLGNAESCLLNINLYPTLSKSERVLVAKRIQPYLEKSILSVSFSRGFGLTASQLGVILVPKRHPLRQRFDQQWNWFTYFYNAIAAKAFMNIDLEEMQGVDEKRRVWVRNWLNERGLPALDSGTYYVKCFRFEGRVPEFLKPLQRGDVLRLCLKPPLY